MSPRQSIVPPQPELKGRKCRRCGDPAQRFLRRCPQCGRRYMSLRGLTRMPGHW